MNEWGIVLLKHGSSQSLFLKLEIFILKSYIDIIKMGNELFNLLFPNFNVSDFFKKQDDKYNKLFSRGFFFPPFLDLEVKPLS